MPSVYELTGSMRGVVVDTELVFPNVQTCLALVAVVNGSLVGVHVTVGDRGRLSAVADLVKGYGMPTDLYVVGPLSPAYNASSFANFGGQPHICDTLGFIDVRARLVGGQVLFDTRPTGTSAWQALPAASFIP